MYTRKYKEDETPQVGDLVTLGGGPFSTCVIVRCREELYDLERVHASTLTINEGDLNGDIVIQIERYSIEVAGAKEKMSVFVTGLSENICNRNRPLFKE